MQGTLDQDHDGNWQLRFERVYSHPIDKVWRAVTEPEQLAAWFPTTIEGDRSTGAPLRFSFPENEPPAFDGRMLAFEPPSLMEIQWGTDIVRFDLAAVPTGAMLVLTVTLDERGKAARDGAGWHVCLDALALALDGAYDARLAMGRWAEVHPEYVERFGPEAATIGPPGGGPPAEGG